jgi:EmrB/QacA subfamily drug resistance transporter
MRRVGGSGGRRPHDPICHDDLMADNAGPTGAANAEQPDDHGPPEPAPAEGSNRLAILLAMAMFVLVVDTTIMNVSISAVTESLDTTVSSVQSAIALEALVSAAFILINSKVGDLIGRKRAYILGLLAYAVGALAMTLAQSVMAIVIFWAIIGGLGASLLLPAMQSLIHGNFEGKARARVYALVGASMAIAAAIGPLIGGVITTFWNWRINFALEVLIIAVVLSGARLVKDVPFTGDRAVDGVGAVLSVVGMGGVVLGILVWQEGGEAVLALIAVGGVALFGLARWLVRRKREGKPMLLDPGLFASPYFRIGVTQQMLQQITLGGSMIVIPIFLQIALEYNALEAGLSIAPLSLSMFFIALLAGRRAGRRRPAAIVRAGFLLSMVGMLLVIPVVPRADSGWALVIPLVVAGTGLGLLVSQLNNYTLAPIEEERASEAAGVNSAGGNFGLSFGLAVAGGVMLATLSIAFTGLTDASDVIPSGQKETISAALEEDAEVVSDTQLQALLADEPADVQEEILAINDEARALSLQVAMLIPVLACLLGLINSFRMVRLPDIEPVSSAEGLDFG